MTLLSHVPGQLIGGGLVVIVLTVLSSAVIVWHGLRRIFDVPRVPRPPAVYGLLAVAWGLLATACVAIVVSALLLRDHQPLTGRTEIGEVRCETTQPGYVRAELTAATPPGRGSERYDIAGDACVVSVQEVELRPGLKTLGLQALARVDGVGSVARPAAKPGWLTALVVRSTRAVPIVVPADSKRFVLVAVPGHDVTLVERPSAQAGI
jgi:hypothetical protein